MANYCVVVASGAHARFFTLKRSEAPVLEAGSKLIERGELSNPEKEIPGRDLYADPKSGRSRAPRGGPAHGYDDHRSQHEDECDRRFAGEVLKKADSFARHEQVGHVVLIAPARMLGCLRQHLEIILKRGVKVHELAKDISKLHSAEIHDYLAKEGLLPARRSMPTTQEKSPSRIPSLRLPAFFTECKVTIPAKKLLAQKIIGISKC